jgi:excisionase family DNA binding protein
MTQPRRATVAVRDKLLLTIPETCELLNVGETTLRKLIREGELKVVRLGTAVRVKRTDLEAYVGSIAPSAEISELPEWIQELALDGRKNRRR